MKERVIDTNIILRFLTGDIPEQFEKSKRDKNSSGSPFKQWRIHYIWVRGVQIIGEGEIKEVFVIKSLPENLKNMSIRNRKLGGIYEKIYYLFFSFKFFMFC